MVDTALHDMERDSAKTSVERPHDDQKNAVVASAALTPPSELDADGEIKQDGVRRTEAITSVWDKKTLILVFVTYVSLSPARRNRMFWIARLKS